MGLPYLCHKHHIQVLAKEQNVDVISIKEISKNLDIESSD